MDKFDLLKSHIEAYTRKDGSVVAAHDDKRAAAAPKDDAYGHPNVVGKPSKMVAGNWTKKTGYKETEHTGKPTDADAIHFAGKKYLSSGKTGTSMHDGTPTRAFHEDDGTDAGGHRIWLDDKARVHADNSNEVAELRRKYEFHTGPADGEVGHEDHKQYGAHFKKGDKVKDHYGKHHEVLWHRGPEVHTTGGLFHPTKLRLT